jgi:uncharacterized protein YceK
MTLAIFLTGLGIKSSNLSNAYSNSLYSWSKKFWTASLIVLDLPNGYLLILNSLITPYTVAD